jgi:hypothetical protein
MIHAIYNLYVKHLLSMTIHLCFCIFSSSHCYCGWWHTQMVKISGEARDKPIEQREQAIYA